MKTPENYLNRIEQSLYAKQEKELAKQFFNLPKGMQSFIAKIVHYNDTIINQEQLQVLATMLENLSYYNVLNFNKNLIIIFIKSLKSKTPEEIKQLKQNIHH